MAAQEPRAHTDSFPADDKYDAEASRVPEGAIQADIDEGFDQRDIKRVMRKIDWRLIPVLSAMYCVSLADRTNLSVVRAANNYQMDKDLGTGIGDRYSIVNLIFFVPYILLELPSQLGLRAFGPAIWLSTAVLLWGVVTLSMAFVTTWNQLAALRAILGIFEAALFPGASYLISCWYPRKSMATRNAVFYIVSTILGSFFSPICYGFSLLQGTRGLSGWSWGFIWYGLATIVVAIVAYFTIVDFPDRATFLTQEERDLITTRIQRDRGDATPDPMSWTKAGKYACDVKIWLFALFFMSSTMAAYSLAFFLPQILGSMGFNNVESMLLNTPCNAYAMIPSLITAYVADKYKHQRANMICVNCVFLIAGTCMYSQLPVAQKAARYVGIFFAVGSSNANVPLVLAWAQSCIRSQSKRAFTAALIVAWGGIGGIFASVTFMNKEAKKGFPTGVFFTLGMNCFVFVASLLLSLWFRWQNKRADRGEIVLEGADDFRYQG